MEEFKWIGRYVLAGLALTYWVIIFANTGELPPMFLTGLVGTAWGTLFISREKEKANAKKVV